ncbi:MAG TPA: LuxR C-terminal-related transcriptional regulator [Actinoplanes sp.]|nr:LuxR C-terminal-related transcriptional regulator [Actinoplanes sp.]
MTGPGQVLATKLFAPAQRAQLVARPRLTGRLDATLAPGHRLTLVSAPAGFGKTTLLAGWLAHLARHRTDVTVAWLSLDDGDNDPARLLTHLVAALQGAGLAIGTAAVEALPDASMGAALTTLVNDVTSAGRREPDRRWVLVLDDYHTVAAPEVHDVVAFLLDHLPDHLRLLLATRADPPLPLARLRSRGQLAELRAADLRFTAAEAQDFLNQVMGLDLRAADVQALDERTEGWIAGLQLAALSLRGIPERGGVDGFIAAFTGSNRFVIDYLADEVLARQPARVREFLLRTAILDRLTGPLCDAVTGGGDGVPELADLERGNLFVVPLDDHRTWYRYHHLFADVLHARLLAEQPGLVPTLHQRASDWYAEHDLVADAVRHAVAAGDFDRAASLMEGALPELRRTRQDAQLLAWMRMLPEPVLRRRPVLSIVAAWSRLMSGDLDAVGARLDDAERALRAGDPASWADTDDLRTAPATIHVYRASLAQARGDVAGTVRHARRALDLARPGDHFVRGAGSGFLGLAAWAAGDVRSALSTFGAAVRSLHAAGNLVDELDSTIVLADMWVAAGRPGNARRLYEQALRAATGTGPPYPRATADLHVGLAELDRELDDLAAAEAHLETARVLAESGSITENRHRWFVAMAQVSAARGDHDTATDLLGTAETMYRRGFYPDLRPIAAMRARFRIAAGDLSSAADWARERDLDGNPDYRYEYEHLTLVRLRLAQHGADCTPVLDLLDRLEAAAAEAGRDGSVREIRVLQALAHHARGDLPQARAVLDRSFTEAPEPDGCVRLYLDEGAPMLALLHHLPGRAVRGAEPLSPREREVLRLLDSELTGPEIARRLYVSLNTLRTHTKRIFTKLGVTTRAAAVRRARERGLL